jgi:hypothetical protein
MRRATIIGILTVWAASLAALFFRDGEREYGDSARVGVAPSGVQSDGDGWWAIYLQGHKVGFVHHALAYGPALVNFRQESVLRLTTLGERQTIRTTASGAMTDDYTLRDFEFSLKAGPTRLELKGTADGEVLRIAVSSEREPLILQGPVFLPLGLRAAATKAPLEAGRVVRGAVLDPLTRTTGILELNVLGIEPLPGQTDRNAWRVRESWRDVESILWVDEHGTLLREEGPMGLVAVRESEAEAARFSPASEDWDAVDAVSLRVDRPLENPRERQLLRVRLRGLPAERIPTGGGQSVDASGVLIRKMVAGELRSYSLPYARNDHAAYLASTASIQADHPRMRSLAKAILGDESDAVAGLQRLVDWVYRYLRKVPTASLPDAMEILDMGQGDCNEHAVLLTALARAVGIPARVVGGLVYSEGAFLYHAWTDAWIGKWVPVDAALNQLPADATHVRLIEGDQNQHALMGMLGKLAIEVVDDAKSSDPATLRH